MLLCLREESSEPDPHPQMHRSDPQVKAAIGRRLETKTLNTPRDRLGSGGKHHPKRRAEVGSVAFRTG